MEGYKMKKMLKVVSIVLCAAMLLMTGCSGNSGTAPASNAAPAADAAPAASGDAPAAEAITLKVGHIYSATHNEALWLEELGKRLEEASGGRLKLSIFGGGQLGTEREMAEQILLGTLDMGVSGGSTWANALNAPSLSALELPFLYKDIDGQKKVMDEVVLDFAEPVMVESGVRPLFCFSASIRGALTTTKPIKSLADISGIKMRVPENNVYVQTWTLLGANATALSWSEAYTSLSQSVVDGVEADPSTLVDANLQEVGKYYSQTNHMGTIHIVGINEAKWQSIPADLQEIFIKTTQEVSSLQVEDRKVTDQAAMDKMAEAGVEIVDVSVEEYNKMAAAVQPLYDEFDAEYGVGDVISKIRELGTAA
ncbi:TRAP transporter substrate-binding protein [Anaerotruncus sp. AF02-27]|jgi:TRAP-type C4-dicarboxylate transport system substrate-binding protein|nr:TRAP transporter substrate-binding protein [Anaerotruncus sp. AF02-27]